MTEFYIKDFFTHAQIHLLFEWLQNSPSIMSASFNHSTQVGHLMDSKILLLSVIGVLLCGVSWDKLLRNSSWVVG
jgi:hypothetical protein